MADASAGQQTTAAAVEEAAERGPTMRVVVQRETAVIVPDGVSPEQLADIASILYGKRVKRVEPVELWKVIGEFEGHTKDAAIERYAGKAGTPDAKIGTWKAPTTRAWAGGCIHEAPPKPLVQRRTLED